MAKKPPAKPLLDPDNFYREGIDEERLPLEEVFKKLRTSRGGLSSGEARFRLDIFGPNKPEGKTEDGCLKFLMFMLNPLSLAMAAAALMALALLDGRDFMGIILMIINYSTLSFVLEETYASNTASMHMAPIIPKTKVLRDGRWQEQDESDLVPGDIISIKLGDVVPADARLLEGDPLKIDLSALTGESVPVTTGHEVFSGSICQQGENEAVVIATGVNSFSGKMAHLADSTEEVGHFKQVLTAIGNFCICSIAVGMVLEIFVMFPREKHSYRDEINNLLVLLIGGIPLAMPTMLSLTLVTGSDRLSQQGAVVKRTTAIEEMAGMDVLCCGKTGTLTLNHLTIDRNLVELFNKDMDKDTVVMLAARASQMESQDAIDAAIVNMLPDPTEARANIQEVHFLPFNPVDKRTAITYIDSDGNWYRASKGEPEQILQLCQEKNEISEKVHTIIDKFTEQGLRSLGVAIQEVPEKTMDSSGGPWKFCGLLPLFDPPRQDSAETIRRALNVGVCVKMITGDQLAIAKETGRRLGMGTNIYPSSSLLLGRNKDENKVLSVDELIEKADGFSGAFSEHKYKIVKILREKKHVVGMAGDYVPALKIANIGIAAADSTDAAKSASDIVVTEPGLSVIVSAVLTSRAIFQRMKSFTIYVISTNIRTVIGFVLLAVIWEYSFPPFLVLIITLQKDATTASIANERVKPSPRPDSWKLPEIFATGAVIGTYLALVTVLFYWVMVDTDFFETTFGVRSLSGNTKEVTSAVYLQVSIIGQALMFVTRSQSWSFMERPSVPLMIIFGLNQLMATLLTVDENDFPYISGIGWGWAGVIWLYSLIFCIPLDIIKFVVRYALSR